MTVLTRVLVCFRPLLFAVEVCQGSVLYAWIKFSAVFSILPPHKKMCFGLAVVTVLCFYRILSLSASTSLWISCIVFPVISVLWQLQLSLSSISPQSCVKDRWFCSWCWYPDTVTGSSFSTADLGEEHKLSVFKPLCQAVCRYDNCVHFSVGKVLLYCHGGWEWCRNG